MSKLNRIQNEIKQLEGGRFQKLCDTYLYCKFDWDNIVSVGSMEGTDKTTKGIPDTYFHNDKTQKYILVMYGTRKDVTSKLEQDIKEAIEKIKLDKKDIQEIICCHTSSNLTVVKDKELRNQAGIIKLTLIGIDTISQDLLKFKYQQIVKDYLGIDGSTDQVWTINEFISIHDKNKTNASLDTLFIDEKNIIDELKKELSIKQIILLSGKPGTGKTRIAIELCKSLSKKNNVICVKSNDLPVYQDIKDTIDNDKINYLLLDDANMITNFDAIISLLNLKEYEGKLKIIMTIRDYALSEIITKLGSFEIKEEKISFMTDELIGKIITSIHRFSPRNEKK